MDTTVSLRATSTRGWAGSCQQQFGGDTSPHLMLRAWGSSGGYWAVLELEVACTHRCHLICPFPMTRLEPLHCFHIIYHPDHITNPKGVELQEKESHKLLGDEATQTQKDNKLTVISPSAPLPESQQTRHPPSQETALQNINATTKKAVSTELQNKHSPILFKPSAHLSREIIWNRQFPKFLSSKSFIINTR